MGMGTLGTKIWVTYLSTHRNIYEDVLLDANYTLLSLSLKNNPREMISHMVTRCLPQ